MEVVHQSRWWILATAISLTGVLAGCDKSQGTVVVTGTGLARNFHDAPERETADNLVVFTPFTEHTLQLWQSMKIELADDFDVTTVEMNEGVDETSMAQTVERRTPKCVVLVGNRAARIYASYQRRRPDAPPAVVLMASFAQEMVDDLRQGIGIVYEVPGVTSFVKLRGLFDRPTRRVGVLYRPKLEGFMERQVELAKLEKVEVVTRRIEGQPGARKIRLALRQLLDSERVDALWVLNDNLLLSEDNLRAGWLPELRGADLPVVVGVSSLVNSQLNFGSVAVVPDHSALGVQAANLIFDLSDEDFRIEENRISLPLSVETVVDMKQAAVFHLAADAYSDIDKAVY